MFSFLLTNLNTKSAISCISDVWQHDNPKSIIYRQEYWPASSAACTSRGTSRTCPPRPWWPADQSPRTGSRRRRRPAPGSRGTACWAAGPGSGDTPGARSGSTYPSTMASQYGQDITAHSATYFASVVEILWYLHPDGIVQFLVVSWYHGLLAQIHQQALWVTQLEVM